MKTPSSKEHVKIIKRRDEVNHICALAFTWSQSIIESFHVNECACVHVCSFRLRHYVICQVVLKIKSLHQLVIISQGGLGTGKTGNLVLTFSRQGKHREFCSNTGKNLLTQGKYLDCDYLYVNFFKFQKF